MKYFKYIITFILLMTTVGGVCKNKGQNMSDNDGNKALWEKLEADKKSNKPKDVLDTAYRIFQNGKAAGNLVETVSALNYVLEYRLQLNDFDKVIAKIEMPPSLSENPKLYLDIIMAMEIEAFAAEVKDEPFRCLLSFIAGRIWQRHLESDYRNIAANKSDDENALDDIKFWSLRQYHDKIVGLYNIALGECMKNVDIADWLPLLSINWCKPNSDTLRAYQQVLPNMFDVLCFEVIPYFHNYFIKSHLELSDSKYFCSAAEFASLDIENDDEMLAVISPLKLYQKLTAEHIKDKNPTAIDYINLRRYDYLSSVYRNTDLKEQKKYFLQTIYDNARKDSSSYGIVSARMAKSILDETDQDDGTNESTKYLRKKAAEILEKGIKNSPKNSEGAMICQSYLDNMKLPEFSFHSLDTIVPNEPTLIQATYRNQDDIYLWVFKVDRDLQESSEFYNSKDRVIQKIMTGTKPIIQRKQKLFNDGLFHKHTSHIVIDPLPVGHYVIITANNDDPKRISEKETQLFYSFVTVTSMAVIERQIEGYHERGLYIVDRTTGQPIENVEVTARYSYRGKNDIFIAKKKTDKTGYVHFNWLNPKAQDKPANNSDENAANATLLDKVKKIFTGSSNGSKDNKNTDKVETEINEYGTYFELRYGDENIIVGKNINRHYFSSYNTIYRKDYRTEFLLDRAIYRPGQRVYFKCIVYDNDEKHIIADKDVDISVVDPNNQKFFTMTKKLNEFGSVDGEFDIPTDRLNGSFTILCDTYGGEKSFTVEEYKRPKFRVTFKPQNVGYQLNKEVKVVGVAKSYAGIPITDAVVGYNVNRSLQIPWWFRGFVDSSQVTVASGQTKTDEHGEFEIKFIAKANVTAAEIACIFNVSANVTDINGETQSDQTSVSIGGLPFDIRMYIPEIVPKGEKKQLTIGVTYRDGQKHTNKGTIVVSKLKSPQTYCVEKPFGNNTAELIREDEFHKLFPHYAYNGENNYENWPVEKKCFTVNYDTAVSDKIDLSRLDGEPIGVYAASLETRDDKGKLIAIKQYFTLTDKSAVLPTPQLSYFQCDKYSAIPGQSVTFDIGSSEPINVFVEKERQSKILEASWHQFSGRKQFSFDINREDCGNVTYHFTFIRNNQSFTFDRTIRVEYNHKELDIQVKTIRDVMQPGEKGTIELTVKDFMGKPIAAELAAVLYDASLNRFASNQWHFNPYRYYYGHPISTYYFGQSQASSIHYANHPYYRSENVEQITFYFGPYRFIVPISRRGNEYGGAMMGRGMMMNSKMAGRGLARMSDEMVMYEECAVEDEAPMMAMAAKNSSLDIADEDDSDTASEKQSFVRTNFAETAFFEPSLRTNENGDVVIKFTMPDSLTTWDFMAFGHTPDLVLGSIRKQIISQRSLMVTTNIMRFLREGDRACLSAKISNISKEKASGTAKLEVWNAATNKILKIIEGDSAKNITVDADGQTAVQWFIKVPDGLAGLTYRITAEAGNYADGEEATLPVLPRRMLVTETIPLSTKQKETKTFSLTKLTELKNHPSITNQQLSVEYTANPAWTALMSLPYLTEYPYDCMEQTFSKIYGNALASHLIGKNPELAQMIANDKSEQTSQLAKNEDLKSILLAESPWLLNAQNEKQGYNEVKQFLDTKQTAALQKKLTKKLSDGQCGSGGWPWFKGGRESFWVTMHIAKEYGHLRQLGIDLSKEEHSYGSMIQKAVYFCDKEAKNWYDFLKKEKLLNENHLTGTAIDYLYMRSFYPDKNVKFRDKTAYNFYMDQARKYWTTLSTPQAAKIMLVLHRAGEKLADEIKESIKQYGLDDKEFGHSWNAIMTLYKSAAISAQALMIEAFCEVEPKYDKIPDMRVWLLKQKQTQDWYTTTATTEAVYALLLGNLESVTKRNEVEIALGSSEKISTLSADNNAGYLRHNILGENVTAEMGNITLTNKSNQLSWGGVFWQYYDDIENVDKNGSAAMRVSKQYIVTASNGREKSPSEPISVGDFVTVRLRITSDRDYEYVHIKDPRPACLEPTDFVSGYVWDKLIYYKSIKDASLNFFIDYLPKGSFVIDYKTKVTGSGEYLSGVTTAQCMYAPEFAAHGEGGRLKVE